MYRSVSLLTLIAFLFTSHVNIFMPLQVIFKPSLAYAEIVEDIKNTCPSDPTQNGRCGLQEIKVDSPSCKTVGNQEICRDWWRKDYVYKCSGSFDPDTILARVGNQYCEYENECTEWMDVEKHGGKASCRIYIDINRPGCSENSYNYSCIVNDCGDLFERCSMKQYVKYSDIPDRANMPVNINCNPASGSCSGQMLDGTKSGVKLGIYTFVCPSEVRKVCKTYSGKVKCPDGREQVCNKVKVCKSQKTVDTKTYELRSCIAQRDMQTYTYVKSCGPHGCVSSAEGEAAKANPLCIKTGEQDLCDKTIGCSDAGSYGIGGFVRHGGTFGYLGGFNACDWGYAEIRGIGNQMINIHASATGCKGSCGGLSVDIPVNTPPGTVIGTVYPHWERRCRAITVTYDGYDCSGGGCIHTIGFHGMGARPVNIALIKIAEDFNCYQDSYQDCSFGDDLQCSRTSSSDVSDLECTEYDFDVERPIKSQCRKYIVNYDCPKDKQITECAEYDEVLNCNDGVYPIRNVRTEDYDFSADFSRAMALAQATNELKHVWSGEPYICESGMWWLFDNMDLGTFLASKAMTAAMQYFGQEIYAQLSPALQTLADCVGAAVTTIMAVSSGFQTTVGAGGTPHNAISDPTGLSSAIKDKIANTLGVQGHQATWEMKTVTTKIYDNQGNLISTRKDTYMINTKDPSQSYNLTDRQQQALGAGAYVGTACNYAAFAISALANLQNLPQMIISRIAGYLGGPLAGVIAGSIVQIATSIRRCSTCTDERCAVRQGHYKQYSLISNRLCHLVASKCSKRLNLGITKICLRTGYRHCCYNSKFARILVEQAYAQLGYSWGSYDNPHCTNLTFDDLKRLDFSAMDFREFIEEVTAKMKGDLNENALKQRIRDRIAVP